MRKLFYRIFQKVMFLGAYFMGYHEPNIIIGENAFKEMSAKIKELGLDSVLIVTDKGLMSFHLLDELFDDLKNEKIAYTVYDEVVPNPTIDNIEAALAMYHENSCKGIIAFGGGSPMDCAKAVGARVVNPKKSISKMKGILKVGKRLPPLFAVPTTAGTGSETTLAAVVTDSATSHKYAINDPHLIPLYAILKPTLTEKLPPHITSTTGMDALCHAVEAYIGKSNTKATKKEAREAVRLIHDNLLTAYNLPNDLLARSNMQQASYLAGLAFTRAYVGYVHAIAHSLGGKYHIPHGLANAVIMPYVFKEYGKSAEKPLAELADLIEITLPSDTTDIKARKFIDYISKMNKEMNIQDKFKEIEASDIDEMATYAIQEANPLYPVPKILFKEDLKKIYFELMQE